MAAVATTSQSADMRHQATGFITDMQRILDSLALLIDHPGRNNEHAYVEMVRLTAQARDTASEAADGMATTAREQPAVVSLPRLSSALGVSKNTLRKRITAPTVHGGGDL